MGLVAATPRWVYIYFPSARVIMMALSTDAIRISLA
jgi:hypothetical protein